MPSLPSCAGVSTRPSGPNGFTLTDLVSYNHKHNEGNGEGNRDGTDDNRSWNCGAEGATSDPSVLELRSRQRRNLMATLLVSQGVAMLHAGDEIGCTKEGNNNSYCQDNELSWLDWEGADREFLDFCARMIDLRRRHPVFRRRRFFQGRSILGTELFDIGWFRPDGNEMTSEDWNAGFAKSLGVFLNGEALPDVDSQGRRLSDDSFLVLFNAHYGDVTFVLPSGRRGELWVTEVDTASKLEGVVCPSGTSFPVAARSMQLLRHT